MESLESYIILNVSGLNSLIKRLRLSSGWKDKPNHMLIIRNSDLGHMS